MHDNIVTTGWKRLTDKVKSLWVHAAEDVGANTSESDLGHEACGAIALGEDRQAAPLAAWEDEGGRTSTSAEALLRKA